MSPLSRANRVASSSAAGSSRRRRPSPPSPTASQQLRANALEASSHRQTPSPESSDFYTADTSNASMVNVTTRKARTKGYGKEREETPTPPSRRKRSSKPREAVDTGKRYPTSPTPCIEDSQPPYVRVPSDRYTGYVPDSYGEETDPELDDRLEPYKRVVETTTTKVVKETIRRPRSGVGVP